MRMLFTVLGIVILSACHKEDNSQLSPFSRTDFFKNDQEALGKIQTILDQRSPGEKLERIESISYIDSKNDSYAFIFYQSNKGRSNVVLRQQYLNGQKLSMTSIRCDGTNCSCQVKTIISSSGAVTTECSCSSCTMLVTKAAAPGIN